MGDRYNDIATSKYLNLLTTIIVLCIPYLYYTFTRLILSASSRRPGRRLPGIRAPAQLGDRGSGERLQTAEPCHG